jgi:hypothetical protein
MTTTMPTRIEVPRRLRNRVMADPDASPTSDRFPTYSRMTMCGIAAVAIG